MCYLFTYDNWCSLMKRQWMVVKVLRAMRVVRVVMVGDGGIGGTVVVIISAVRNQVRAAVEGCMPYSDNRFLNLKPPPPPRGKL